MMLHHLAHLVKICHIVYFSHSCEFPDPFGKKLHAAPAEESLIADSSLVAVNGGKSLEVPKHKVDGAHAVIVITADSIRRRI